MSKVLILIFMIFPVIPISVLAKDITTEAITQQIDYLQKKHEVLAENIANVSTPKYITKDIEPPKSMSGKEHKVSRQKVRMALTNTRHINADNKASGKYNLTLDKTSPMKPNKNNVDLAGQVGKIAVNSDKVSEALKNYRSSMELLGMASDAGGAK